ncbi:XTP/dITP diphosphatase [Anaerocolumna sedimenticola]|uniref:dITP/XTP pyrophosphatase n=1 Tax=Anaerocolumna sedimenticola TaxID=2696063 RepID=A0A6P1TFE5_9FIRM|nr:XTP/dITP diphosphatase [Anaerocolumna sedimenticola]QHQ59910.1 XTP/dITP diphosphatase [Anaerocolumna sedimenticola]
MNKRIIFATSNEGKMKEIRLILKDLDYDIVSMKEAGIFVDIIEDGSTFEENAVIKAKTIMEMTGEMVLADDSGLEVDAMDKAPGIYSARFLGEDTSYDMKNNYILNKLKDLPEKNRSARFVCAIACVFPDGEVVTTRATIEGSISYEIAGNNGFGYDPIFWVPEYGCTSAQLSTDIKNQISHRGKALESMKDIIKNKLK